MVYTVFWFIQVKLTTIPTLELDLKFGLYILVYTGLVYTFGLYRFIQVKLTTIPTLEIDLNLVYTGLCFIQVKLTTIPTLELDLKFGLYSILIYTG